MRSRFEGMRFFKVGVSTVPPIQYYLWCKLCWRKGKAEKAVIYLVGLPCETVTYISNFIFLLAAGFDLAGDDASGWPGWLVL